MIRIKFVYIILLVLTLLDFGITVSLAYVGGTWKIIGFGADSMGLTQSGNHVYGTYNTPQGQGIIGGYINAQKVWIGTWTEPFMDDWGYFLVLFPTIPLVYMKPGSTPKAPPVVVMDTGITGITTTTAVGVSKGRSSCKPIHN